MEDCCLLFVRSSLYPTIFLKGGTEDSLKATAPVYKVILLVPRIIRN